MCSEETNLMDSREMTAYAEITADFDGVSGEGWESRAGLALPEQGDTLHGKCWMEHFWLAPSCRGNSSKCVLAEVKRRMCTML